MGYLACVLARRIGAFAVVEGEFFAIPGGCRPTAPASVLDVHAVTDPIAPYAGVPARGSPDYCAPAIPTWLVDWSVRDGCRHQQRTSLISHSQTEEIWTSCDGRVLVEGYRLTTGNHVWPSVLGTAGGSAALLAFFAAHPLPRRLGSWHPHPGSSAPALGARALVVRSARQFAFRRRPLSLSTLRLAQTARSGSRSSTATRSDGSAPMARYESFASPHPMPSPISSRPARTERCGSPNTTLPSSGA